MTFSCSVFSLMAVISGLNMQASRPLTEHGWNPLPDHATPVAKVSDWVKPYYLWRNNTTIIVFRGDLRTQVLEGLDDLHLNTGHRFALEALNQKWQAISQFQAGADVRGWAIRWAAISPDRTWIVWSGQPVNVDGQGPGLMTFSLFGSHWFNHNFAQSLVSEPNTVVWMPDSYGWIGLSDNAARDRSDSLFPGIAYYVDTHNARVFRLSHGFTVLTTANATWVLLAHKPNGRMIVLRFDPGYHHVNDVQLAEIGKDRDKGAIRRWVVKMPGFAYAPEVELSPDGDRLIWNLSFMPDRSHDSHPGSGADHNKSHNEIWISKVDGSGMRRLDDLVYEQGASNTLGIKANVYGVQWAPDGQRISFIYQGVLYLVAVP
jgi:hypothetical protein